MKILFRFIFLFVISNSSIQIVPIRLVAFVTMLALKRRTILSVEIINKHKFLLKQFQPFNGKGEKKLPHFLIRFF